MKYIRQVFILFLVSFMGEILSSIVPFPVPSGVWGLIILFLLLLSGVVKVENVRAVASFLIEIMPMMFIPATVAVMTLKSTIAGMLLPFLCACTVLTVLVAGISGKVTDMLMKGEKDE